ncbi:LacI family DNA-binding transcriptional regulator [Micromonospora sp. LOL_023]|uniref:LacI family DNA-binding transcriptional regulator n=1 Tax=Micromonospora sp. LOL_023 TaxID=3345418 RepID=UPI003A89A10C
MAKEAGVSHQTVSRFLRGNGGLRPATVEKITRAVELLNYRPNRAARAMRTRRTDRIAIVMPDITPLVPNRLLQGAAGAAHDAGFHIDIVSLEGSAADRAARTRALLQPETVDGILSFAPLQDSLDGSGATEFPVPIVIVGEYDDNMRGRNHLADAAPVTAIIGYLAANGHRRFVHVAGSPSWASARNRRSAYEATVERLGLESCAVVDGDWTVRSGYEAARTVVAGCGATAVFAANDQVALGVILGLQSVGIDVPGQVSVFGWDDEEIGRYFRPSLSTVAVDRERHGRLAMQRLLALMRGEPLNEAFPADLQRLVLRDSTGPASV